MSAETELHALLKANAGVQSALGVASAAAAGNRIAADRAEQGTARPYAVFVRVGTEDFVGIDGSVHASKVTLELQCWGDTRQSVETLANACQSAIRAANHEVVSRTAGFDEDRDEEATVLSIEWWPA